MVGVPNGRWSDRKKKIRLVFCHEESKSSIRTQQNSDVLSKPRQWISQMHRANEEINR